MCLGIEKFHPEVKKTTFWKLSYR